MGCCCTKIYKLPCPVDWCTGTVNTNVNSVMAGNYMLELEFLGSIIRIVKPFEELSQLIFPVDGLNENFTYVGRVRNPDGTYATITVDSENYDCIEFTTIMTREINLVPAEEEV